MGSEFNLLLQLANQRSITRSLPPGDRKLKSFGAEDRMYIHSLWSLNSSDSKTGSLRIVTGTYGDGGFGMEDAGAVRALN